MTTNNENLTAQLALTQRALQCFVGVRAALVELDRLVYGDEIVSDFVFYVLRRTEELVKSVEELESLTTFTCSCCRYRTPKIDPNHANNKLCDLCSELALIANTVLDTGRVGDCVETVLNLLREMETRGGDASHWDYLLQEITKDTAKLADLA